jgi:hypothetical protein
MYSIEENEISRQDKNKTPISKTQKIICFLIVILVFIFTNFFTFHDVEIAKKQCNIDKFFEMTENLNKIAKNHEYFRNILMTISSFLIDISVISIGIGWLLYSRSWRCLLSIGLFYLLRGIVNASFAMKFPENIIWEYPGIPSFSVSYHETSDFFFSGHVGINLIAAIELYRFNMKKISFLSFIGIFFQMFTMIVFRGHYSIDLIAGLISAHYCNIISFKLVGLFDYLINLDERETQIFCVAYKD